MRITLLKTLCIVAALLCITQVNANGVYYTLIKQQTVNNDSIPGQPEDISPLLTGETIPAINIPGAGGKLYNVNESLAKKPAILIFYRGGWCPFCNKQLSGIQQIESKLRNMGYEIIAISTDSPARLAETAGKDQLTYTLLSDADLAVSKQFGIAYKGPEGYSKILMEGSEGKNVDKLLPVPSVFIVDTKGVIQFEYINPDFKQRINPDLLLAVAQTLAQ